MRRVRISLKGSRILHIEFRVPIEYLEIKVLKNLNNCRRNLEIKVLENLNIYIEI